MILKSDLHTAAVRGLLPADSSCMQISAQIWGPVRIYRWGDAFVVALSSSAKPKKTNRFVGRNPHLGALHATPRAELAGSAVASPTFGALQYHVAGGRIPYHKLPTMPTIRG